jgi:PIN domain nuclease of toxin-antitoxin system
MKLLLDTHTFLWFVLGDAQLSKTARLLITDAGNEKLVSPASYWELAIKISIGKFTLHEPLEDFLDRGIAQNGFGILAIVPKHVVVLVALRSITATPLTGCWSRRLSWNKRPSLVWTQR